MKNKVFLSIVIGAVICLSLLLFQAGRTGVSNVLLPSELVAHGGQALKRIRLAGRVADAEIKYEIEPELLLQFSLQDPNQTGPMVLVKYKGLRPDMFAVGRDVILDGNWQDNLFVAQKMMTQCPSKYEPPKL